jgi:hypothetical protein
VSQKKPAKTKRSAAAKADLAPKSMQRLMLWASRSASRSRPDKPANGTVWTQQGNKLVGTGAVGVARQGHSVAISADGNNAIVGGPYDNSYIGAAWVYRRG